MRLPGTANGSTPPAPQPDPITAQLVSQVQSLVKTVDDLQSVVKQQELIIKQELCVELFTCASPLSYTLSYDDVCVCVCWK